MPTKQSIRLKLKKQSKDKTTDPLKVKKFSLFSGTIIGAIIIITPYLYYLYQGFPSTKSMETFFGTFESNYWEDVNISAWVIFGKIIPLLLLLIWFFTCKHWWYHTILVPICMYAFQIYSNISAEIRFSDVNEFFALAPIVFIMAIFSYTVRTRVFDKIHGIDLSELSRVNWKGELKQEFTTENDDNNDDDDDDDDEMFMSY